MREGRSASGASVPALITADFAEVRRSEVERFRRDCGILGKSQKPFPRFSTNRILSQASQTRCSTTSQCRHEPGQLRPDMI